MKYIITQILLFVCFWGYSQANFKWEKIDSVAKSKEQIYSDTKMFIGETWRQGSTAINNGQIAMQVLTGNGQSTKNLSPEKHNIQNDDKEAGVILVKGEMEFNSNFMMNLHIYRYTYDIRFFMKDNKYKVIIENVHCVYAHCANYDWPLVEPCEGDDCPGYGKTGMPKEKYNELMASLKANLQGILDGYATYIKTPGVTKSDW